MELSDAKPLRRNASENGIKLQAGQRRTCRIWSYESAGAASINMLLLYWSGC